MNAIAVKSFAGTEKERLVARAEICMQIAEQKNASQRRRELKKVISDCEQGLDDAADAHGVKVEPLQKELESIRAQQIEDSSEQRTVDTELMERRQVLRGELQAANVELETDCVKLRIEMGVAQQEKHTIENDQRAAGVLPLNVLEGRLFYLGPMELQLRRFSTDQQLQWAVQRHKHASGQLSNNQGRLQGAKVRKEASSVELYESRIPRWEFEVQAASESLREVEAAMAEILQQLKDE